MHPENIKVGQWIVITGIKPDMQQFDNDYYSTPEPVYQPSGIPVQVQAISYPFCVTIPIHAPDSLYTICLKTYQVATVTKAYVNVFKKQIARKAAQGNQQKQNRQNTSHWSIHPFSSGQDP